MKKILIICVLVLLLLAGVWIGYRLITKEMEAPLVLVSAKNLPDFNDDLNGAGLKQAISLHIDKLQKTDLDKKVKFGEVVISRERILNTLILFRSLLDKKGIDALSKEISKNFLIFQASGRSQKGDVLFTSYYQPILEARTFPEGEFQYPLYQTPPDLQLLDLGKINPKYAGEKIALRVEDGVVRPYFDRRAIDKDGALAGKGLELLYLNNYLDRYMLQVQGSGIMRVENGEEIKVHYAASNCFPYVSLAKTLINQGKLDAYNASLKAIKVFFQLNPEEGVEASFQNRRYIFFEEYTGNVRGSENVELTPGRSIATDKTIFPGGGLAFIICRRPVYNEQGRVIKWEPLIRFMVDQDTGAAIIGPGRVDIFWGTGDEAGKIAGSIKEEGKLYYLLIK